MVSKKKKSSKKLKKVPLKPIQTLSGHKDWIRLS
jgi:hypothetical protein